MCGIVGLVQNNSRAVMRETVEKMNRCIVHRGPDEDGFYIKENVGLAMRRLAIIDLKGGQQPIFNEDRTKAIVFNGEIYNFHELRENLEKRGHRFYTNCDTEIIVHLYDEYGADCVNFLRGMFAFAIWDETDKSLFIARDRLGKKPLLYSHQLNGDLIFGSEFSALLSHPAITREVDYEAIDEYLSYLCVPAPRTAFKQIRKLEPAHWLRWKNGKIEMQRYWLPDFSEKIKISDEEAVEETTRVMREATKARLISEVPLGAFLSGGVDSSIIVALMAEASANPVKTFSIGFDEADFSELKYAKMVAEHIGAEHREFIVRPDAMEILPKLIEHYGEPYADSSSIPTYYVSRETRKHVTVALNGDGGDESFAGYERYMGMKAAETYHKIPGLARKALIEFPASLIPESKKTRSRLRSAKRFVESASLGSTDRYFRWMSAIAPKLKSELLTDNFRRNLNGTKPIDALEYWFERADGADIIDKTMFVDQMTYLPNDLLVKVDIASMANSLEARSPFLDHKVIEFAATLPADIKVKKGDTKTLLKKVAANLVPREAIYRRKMGFGVPIGAWLRGEMREFMRENLLSEKFNKRGLFDRGKVENLIEEHQQQKRDHATPLWTLLMLELWFQRFID